MNNETKDVLISIKPQYTSKIKSGDKTIELRTRLIDIKSGDRIWIYSTKPAGEIILCVFVDRLIVAKPTKLWSLCNHEASIQKNDFFEYFKKRRLGYGIKFNQIKTLKEPIKLESIRNILPNFNPPQFYKKLYQDNKLLKILKYSIDID